MKKISELSDKEKFDCLKEWLHSHLKATSCPYEIIDANLYCSYNVNANETALECYKSIELTPKFEDIPIPGVKGLRCPCFSYTKDVVIKAAEVELERLASKGASK